MPKNKLAMTEKSDKAVHAVIEAALSHGLTRFILAFNEEMEDGKKLATTRLHDMPAREVMTLGLMVFEQGIQHELAQERPEGYKNILRALLNEVGNASLKANQAIQAVMDAKRSA